MVGGDWWLVIGGWWRFAVVSSCQLVAAGGWRRLAVGGWWRLAVGGGWWLAVGGPLGRSIRAVLNKKKSSSSRTPLWDTHYLQDWHWTPSGWAKGTRAKLLVPRGTFVFQRGRSAGGWCGRTCFWSCFEFRSMHNPAGWHRRHSGRAFWTPHWQPCLELSV